MPQSVMGNLFREFDPHRSRLLLSENLQESQRLFQTAAQIALVVTVMLSTASSAALILMMIQRLYCGSHYQGILPGR